MWKGVVVQCNNVLSTFSWNFMDLFLILLSTALTYHFSQLNDRLYSVKDKVNFTFISSPFKYEIIQFHTISI